MVFQGTDKWQTKDPVAYHVSFPQTDFMMNVGIRRSFDPLNKLYCIRADNCEIIIVDSSSVPENEHKLGNCFFMTLINVAAPTWKKVNCNQPLVQHIFCQMPRQIEIKQLKLHPDIKSCLKGHILLKNTCYIFTWHNLKTKIQETCPSQKIDLFHIKQFQILFDATTDTFPPLFSPDLEYIITYKRYWNTYSYKLDSKHGEKQGMYVCERPQSDQLIGDYVFQCNYGIYISYIFLCDGKNDCPGKISADEVGCECNTNLNYTSQCKMINMQSQMVCSDLYFRTWNGTCEMYDSTLVPYTKVEIIKGSAWKQKRSDQNKGKLSCLSIDSIKHIFYEISEICSYKLNEHGYLLPCNKGEHLQNCKMFECNMMFKCPNFYCIPWHYICDGKWDCPSGYDKIHNNHCENRTCFNMFKCKMSSVCLHLGNVCNGKFECPHHDDESLCLLKESTCPSGCHCLAFAMRCYQKDISKYTLPIHFPYISVTIMKCSLFTEDILKATVQYVSFLSLINTNFKSICTVVPFMKHIITLDVSKNAISQIKKFCFKDKLVLRVIKLNNNLLQLVNEFAFYNMKSLLYIDLSNNQLIAIFKYSIVESKILSFLSLENNSLEAIKSKDIFNDLNIKFLRIEYFSLCCFAKAVKCYARIDCHASCANLLINKSMKCTFYLLSAVIILTNVLHLLLVLRRPEEVRQIHQKVGAFNSIVTSVSILDMTGSVPLFTLWISDTYFKDDLVLIQNQWKSSIMCFISGGINIYYGLASPFLYNLLSYARYDIVKHPLDSKFKRSNFIFKIVLVGCIFSVSFAILTVTVFWWMSNGMPTVYCSPFFSLSSTFPLAEKLAWLIISVKFIAVLFNLIIHSKLVTEVMKTRKDENMRAKSRNQSNMSFIIQIICISSSHLLCWITSIILLIYTNYQKNYPVEIILFKLVFITPLNSILIPIIFITKKIKELLE